jgi:hypothetical protein
VRAFLIFPIPLQPVQCSSGRCLIAIRARLGPTSGKRQDRADHRNPERRVLQPSSFDCGHFEWFIQSESFIGKKTNPTFSDYAAHRRMKFSLRSLSDRTYKKDLASTVG